VSALGCAIGKKKERETEAVCYRVAGKENNEATHVEKKVGQGGKKK
jgi:hypothetical protein